MRKLHYMAIALSFITLSVIITSCSGCKVKEVGEKQSVTEKQIIQSTSVTDETLKKQQSVYPEEIHSKEENYWRVAPGVYVQQLFAESREDKNGSIDVMEYTKLDFYDTLGTKINSFDIHMHNPYNYKTIDNLIEDLEHSPSYYGQQEILDKGLTPEVYYTSVSIPQTRTFPIIGYNLIGLYKGRVVESKFSAICLDENGEIIKEFRDMNVDVNSFCVSANKEFFCVSYGGLRGENLTHVANSGIRIYEIISNEKVYEKEIDNKLAFSGPISKENNWGAFGVKGNDFHFYKFGKHFYKIDFSRRMIYDKYFSKDQLKSIKGVNSRGFYIVDSTTNQKVELHYETDFNKQAF